MGRSAEEPQPHVQRRLWEFGLESWGEAGWGQASRGGEPHQPEVSYSKHQGGRLGSCQSVGGGAGYGRSVNGEGRGRHGLGREHWGPAWVRSTMDGHT